MNEYLLTYLLLGLFPSVAMVIKTTDGSWKIDALMFLIVFPFWPVAMAMVFYGWFTRLVGLCMWCGKIGIYTDKQDAAEEVREHVLVCEKHPMRIEIERLEGEIRELRWALAVCQAEAQDGLVGQGDWQVIISTCERILEVKDDHAQE